MHHPDAVAKKRAAQDAEAEARSWAIVQHEVERKAEVVRNDARLAVANAALAIPADRWTVLVHNLGVYRDPAAAQMAALVEAVAALRSLLPEAPTNGW